MQNTQVCEIESMSRPFLKALELMYSVAWEKWQLRNTLDFTGMDLSELSRVGRILEVAPKLGIDLSKDGTLSSENLTAIIRFIFFQQETQGRSQSTEESKEKMLNKLSGYKPTEESQQPTSSLPNVSPSPQPISTPSIETRGVKYDNGKPRFDLLPPRALEEIAKVFSGGASKYGDRNWENGIHFGRVFGAVQRHLWKWMSGEDRDPEWNLSHLAHAAAGVLFLLHYSQQQQLVDKFDDRPSKKCETNK